jgi:hypothetical protein
MRVRDELRDGGSDTVEERKERPLAALNGSLVSPKMRDVTRGCVTYASHLSFVQEY